MTISQKKQPHNINESINTFDVKKNIDQKIRYFTRLFYFEKMHIAIIEKFY